MKTTRLTLERGIFGWAYSLRHPDNRSILSQGDGGLLEMARWLGWSPCSGCRRTCRGLTDGTQDCQRCTVEGHVDRADDWLAARVGRTFPDNGRFEVWWSQTG